jgi:mono/diheme cytochrome c family protein
MKIQFAALALSILLALTFTIPVFAGGWAVITLDELPAEVAANQPIEIGFTVLQHGKTPLGGLSPTIGAQLIGGNKTVLFTAKEQGKLGHYAATLTFPADGQWSWTIDAFNIPQAMPLLLVIPAAHSAAEAVNAVRLPIAWLLVGVAGIGSVLAGVFTLKGKNLIAVGLIAFGLVVAVTGFASAAGQLQVKSEAPISVARSGDQVAWGHDLFIAKGCITCHSHANVNEFRGFDGDIGPDLTNFSAAPEYLRMRLHDPKSVKSDSQMPKLTLNDAEIEALIAFINSD